MTTITTLFQTAEGLLTRMQAEDRNTIKDVEGMLERLDRMEANMTEEIMLMRQCAQSMLDGRRTAITEAIGAPGIGHNSDERQQAAAG